MRSAEELRRDMARLALVREQITSIEVTHSAPRAKIDPRGQSLSRRRWCPPRQGRLRARFEAPLPPEN
jgi:hypothetical protein